MTSKEQIWLKGWLFFSFSLQYQEPRFWGQSDRRPDGPLRPARRTRHYVHHPQGNAHAAHAALSASVSKLLGHSGISPPCRPATTRSSMRRSLKTRLLLSPRWPSCCWFSTPLLSAPVAGHEDDWQGGGGVIRTGRRMLLGHIPSQTLPPWNTHHPQVMKVEMSPWWQTRAQSHHPCGWSWGIKMTVIKSPLAGRECKVCLWDTGPHFFSLKFLILKKKQTVNLETWIIFSESYMKRK